MCVMFCDCSSAERFTPHRPMSSAAAAAPSSSSFPLFTPAAVPASYFSTIRPSFPGLDASNVPNPFHGIPSHNSGLFAPPSVGFHPSMMSSTLMMGLPNQFGGQEALLGASKSHTYTIQLVMRWSIFKKSFCLSSPFFLMSQVRPSAPKISLWRHLRWKLVISARMLTVAVHGILACSMIPWVCIVWLARNAVWTMQLQVFTDHVKWSFGMWWKHCVPSKHWCSCKFL